MLAFNIVETEMKDFMSKLLKEETFDLFEVRGVELNSFTRFEISGILDKDFLPENGRDTSRNYCRWQELRPHVFSLIRGSKKPKSFKIIFSLPPEQVTELHQSASAYFLNLTFDGNEMLCTTASSEKTFTMDKSIEYRWQEYITDFFKQNQIVINTLE